MSLFCPTCHNLLHLGDGTNTTGEGMMFRCSNCPYVFQIKEKVKLKKYLTPRPPDDAISAREEMKKAAKTPAVCPECGHNEAYYFEMQIRSGDEPATLFFCCTECHARWKENDK